MQEKKMFTTFIHLIFYIIFMQTRFIILFFFIIWGIVSAAPPKLGEHEVYCDVIPMCIQISAAMGMQLYSVNTLYEKSEIKYSDPDKSPSLSRTVNISGIVDSLWNQEAYVHDEYKEKVGMRIYYQETIETDSINQPIFFTETKRISLKLFKIVPGGDPFMESVLDSSWIYVPFNLDIHVSDSIVIEGYSALASNYCDSCYYTYRPTATIIGQYKVYPNKSSAIKNTRARKENAAKKRNRDATGKKVKNNTVRKIVY